MTFGPGRSSPGTKPTSSRGPVDKHPALWRPCSLPFDRVVVVSRFSSSPPPMLLGADVDGDLDSFGDYAASCYHARDVLRIVTLENGAWMRCCSLLAPEFCMTTRLARHHV